MIFRNLVKSVSTTRHSNNLFWKMTVFLSKRASSIIFQSLISVLSFSVEKRNFWAFYILPCKKRWWKSSAVSLKTTNSWNTKTSIGPASFTLWDVKAWQLLNRLSNTSSIEWILCPSFRIWKQPISFRKLKENSFLKKSCCFIFSQNSTTTCFYRNVTTYRISPRPCLWALISTLRLKKEEEWKTLDWL